MIVSRETLLTRRMTTLYTIVSKVMGQVKKIEYAASSVNDFTLPSPLCVLLTDYKRTTCAKDCD